MKPRRFNWQPVKLPWYWVFTFWRNKWKIRSVLVSVNPEDPGYETAELQETLIMHPDAYKMLISDESVREHNSDK